MIDIILTIVLFNVLIVLFKLFERFGVDNLQALTVNYLAAGVMGLINYEGDISISYIIQSDWSTYSLIIGFLFIVVFNLYATGAQKAGMAISTVANKMSLVIPVIAAILLYPDEHFSIIKILGFVLALLGIYFSSTTNNKLSFDPKYLWIIILIFIGQGAADAIFNHARYHYVTDADKPLFFLVLFITAGLSGLLMIISKTASKQRPVLHWKNIVAGIAFGIPNYGSLIFMFNALKSSGIESSKVYPLVSMGIIALSAIIGWIFFSERLSKTNWAGIFLAIAAIAVISVAN